MLRFALITVLSSLSKKNGVRPEAPRLLFGFMTEECPPRRPNRRGCRSAKVNDSSCDWVRIAETGLRDRHAATDL
jgi:hypothetical protein